MRCAIYTRVSTDEQANKEFSSLESQREVCEHYIQVQKEKGWVLGGVYEDPGYSGKDLERPGINELLADVKMGRIDVVLTYKIDRIARTLRDFYRFWEELEENKASFVSATQNFDTSDSMGMLMLNILLSFAQFERDLTIERTMSKMAIRAQRGKWNGGWVPIGYDYSKHSQLLSPNPQEKKIVKEIFKLYIRTRKLGKVQNEINRRGHRTKSRVVIARGGKKKAIGSNRFDEDSIKAILRNPIYKGFIRYKNEFFPGEHEAIIDAKTWEEANKILDQGQRPKALRLKDDHIHLLKGLVRCGDCGLTMTPYPSGKKDKAGRPYLYYSCTAVSESGRHSSCRVRSLPAREFERIVKTAISDLGKDKDLLEKSVKLANQEAGKSIKPLLREERRLRDRTSILTREINRIINILKRRDLISEDLTKEYKELIAEKEDVKHRLEKNRIDIERNQKNVLSADVIQKALRNFSGVIDALPLEDQKELMQLLIREIVVSPFDPKKGKLPREKGAFPGKIRTKWYKIKMSLHQTPWADSLYEVFRTSSENRFLGSPGRTRTADPVVNSHLLCQLSYWGSLEDYISEDDPQIIMK